jgi:small membrane protein
MIAQITFSLVLLAIVLMAFVQVRQIPLVGAAVISAALFGGYLIWNPDNATAMAHWFGVGRGTDLVLYVWVLISSAVMLILYLNSREQFQIVTGLARAIALAEASTNAQSIGQAKQTESNP